MTAEMRKLVLGNNDLLIVTLGSLEHNIFPTEKDMKDWRKILDKFLGPKFKKRCLIVPDVCKFKVLKALRKGESK